MRILGMLGFLFLLFAILISTDKSKYDWLVNSVGLKGNAKFAVSYYTIMGLLLLLGSFVTNDYITSFVIPILAIAFSVVMSVIILIVKYDNRKAV